MPRSKELSDNLRKRVVEAHLNGNGSKTIAKRLSIHVSTVRQIVYKWKQLHTTANQHRSGRPPKATSRVTRYIVRQIQNNPRLTSVDIKKYAGVMSVKLQSVES